MKTITGRILFCWYTASSSILLLLLPSPVVNASSSFSTTNANNKNSNDICPIQTLIFQDEFDGTTLDTSIWTPQIGNGCEQGINLCGWYVCSCIYAFIYTFALV